MRGGLTRLAIPRLSLATGILGLALLVFAVVVALDEQRLSAFSAMAGFLALSVAAFTAGFRAAAGLALIFSVYGGLSAAIAVNDFETTQGFFYPHAFDISEIGVFSSLLHPPVPSAEAFRYAMVVTCLGGVAAIAAAIAAVSLSREPVAAAEGAQTEDARPEAVGFAERAGKVLVLVGLAGFLLAAIRYAAIDHTGESLFQGLKSLWTGGSYALLLATFAIPGMGLWLHGLLSRERDRGDLAWFAVTALGITAISFGTGQRGFLIQLVLVSLVVLGAHYRITRFQLAGLAAAAIVVLGVSQALRNSIRETGGASLGELATRLEPSRWEVLLGSQFASFSYTWETANYRDQMDIPNTFLAVLAKPVPRQLYPDKVQGYGEEFTRELHGAAHIDQVSFATPLVAEADFVFGVPGVLLILGALGLALGLAEARLIPRAPPELRAVLVAGAIWVGFVLLRGDFANGLVASAGWVLPLTAVCAAAGYLPRAEGSLSRWAAGATRAAFEWAHARTAPAFGAVDAQVREVWRQLRATDWRGGLPGTPYLIALGVLLAAAAAYALYLGRDLTFYRDEWVFILYRDGHDLENFLSSYAGNLFPWLTGLFAVMFKTVGLDSYWAFRVVGLTGHLVCVVALYALLRRRIGDAAALAPALVVLFLGAGWPSVIFPIQIAFTAAITCGLLALLLLDRDDLAGDVAACAFLVIGVGWASPILPFIPAIGVGLFLRGRLWTRLWVVAVPAAIYLAWTLGYGTQDVQFSDNVGKLPDYVATMAGAAVAGPTSISLGAARVIAVAGLGLIIVLLVRRGRRAILGWEGLVLVGALIVLTAVARAQYDDPTAPRYVYITVVFAFVLFAGLIPKQWPTGRVTAYMTGLALLTLIPSAAAFQDARDELTDTTGVARAELGAVEIAAASVAPDFAPPLKNFAVPAGPYLTAVDRYGSSPAFGPDEIAEMPEENRAQADAVLVSALGLAVRPAKGAAADAEACRQVEGGPGAETVVPPGGLLLTPDGGERLEVSVRRFASETTVPLATPGTGRAGVLRPLGDAAPERPWTAVVGPPGASVTVCPVERPRLAQAARRG